jgi:hypothetical protein
VAVELFDPSKLRDLKTKCRRVKVSSVPFSRNLPRCGVFFMMLHEAPRRLLGESCGGWSFGSCRGREREREQ